MTTMFVTKASEPVRKDNVALVDSQSDVPAHLQEIVTVEDGYIFIGACIEGKELWPVHSFIAWEHDDACEGGYNVWFKADGHTTLFRHDGAWYQRPTLVKYQEIDWENPVIPDFVKGDSIIDVYDGKIVLHASWGEQTAYAPEPYAVLGYEDGSYALLKLDSDSAREYNICTEEGLIIEPLVK